jgi:small subunit ribosomal protein S16
MVKVRLARFGAKKHPYYHIVVTDSDNRRDGRFIEKIGKYDPALPPTAATLDEARLAYWLGKGAQVSVTAARVVRLKAAATAAAAG